MTREQRIIGKWVEDQFDSIVIDGPVVLEEKVTDVNRDISDFLPEFHPEECHEDFSDLITHTLAEDIF